jgi:hypothetical protein
MEKECYFFAALFSAGAFPAGGFASLGRFSATGNLTSGATLLDSGLYLLSSTGRASHVSAAPVCLSCSSRGKTSSARLLGNRDFLFLVCDV